MQDSTSPRIGLDRVPGSGHSWRLPGWSLLAFFLLAGAAFGQITLPDEADPHTPIVAGCNCVIPDGAEVRIVWRASDAAHLIPVGNQAHVWAPPGTHEISMTLVWMRFEEVDAGGKKLRVLLEWDMQAYSRKFVVRGTPTPPPGPSPPPPPGPPPPTPPTPGDFAAQVRAALALVPASHRKYAKDLADNYEGVAAQAAANPSSWDPAAMVNEVKTRHATSLSQDSVAAWLPFWGPLGKAQRDRKLSPTDLDGHIAMFHEIAAVLREVQASTAARRPAVRAIPSSVRVVHGVRQ